MSHVTICLYFGFWKETLLRKFRRYGKISGCRLVRDIVTGISKQYAFIEFESSSSAKDAVHEMDQRRIDDMEIIVDFEHERRLKGWKPRRLGGGFGGKKESGQLRFGCRSRPFQRPFDSNKLITSRDIKEIFRHQKYNKWLKNITQRCTFHIKVLIIKISIDFTWPNNSVCITFASEFL